MSRMSCNSGSATVRPREHVGWTHSPTAPVRSFTSISNPIAFQGRLFFVGVTSSGPRLYASKDVAGNLQIEPISSQFPANNTILNVAVMDATRLFFSVDDGAVANGANYQLWTSTGLAGSTQTLSIRTFMRDSSHGALLKSAQGFAGNLYFSARQQSR